MIRLTRRRFSATTIAALLFSGSARAATTHQVTIRNMQFSPQSLNIRAGDIVEWTNRDSERHTATAADRAWDTGILKKGDSGQITFSAAGKFDYFCAVHPGMKASVTVT